MTQACRTTCPYCGVGCGVIASRTAEGGVEIKGDPAHPANFGLLCSKGAALGETIGPEERLLYPEIGGALVSWDKALAYVAARFQDIIAAHGPDAVAFYVSGQLLTEDYYAANKLMKGFIGSANIDTNSRLCMSSSVAGHVRAFGGDVVPGCYEDLAQAELIIFTGANAAWCHPVLFRRIEAAKERNPALKIVVIDPRRTETCDIADLHLPVKPGSDAVLFNGLLAHLHRAGLTDQAFVAGHTQGVEAALEAADISLSEVAAACRLAEADVRAFFDMVAATTKTVTLYSQGINQSSSGTDKVNAIINSHLLTGRIGRPGMGPFSLTGQPNAMGGREVGGLANQLAAHMALDDPTARARVAAFWGVDHVAETPGYKAVDLFKAIGAGKVKAVWIMATNPAVSLPDGEQVRAALADCDFVAVSDCTRATDTAAFADVLLPAAPWGEKDGTVTNSERRISRQRAFLPALGEARPDWWIISGVARAMGFGAAFAYDSAADIFREHATLSGLENKGARAFDISGLANLDEAAYDTLEPIQWPVTPGQPHGTARLFGDGGFVTETGKARFVAVTPRGPVHPVDDDYPLTLNTGRVRDHWHTLTRTGKSARLSGHIAEPFAALHPVDAERRGIEDQALVSVASRWGDMIARAMVSDRQTPGEIFVPIHWTDQFAGRGRVDALVNPEVDPISGQPELKQTPVRVRPYKTVWSGLAFSRAPLGPDLSDYWVRAKAGDCWRYELAGRDFPAEPERWARALLNVPAGETDWLILSDKGAGRFRAAWLREGRLQACLFLDASRELPSRAWAEGMFAGALDRAGRTSLLAGAAVTGRDRDRTVCSCFSVGLTRIQDAINTQNLTSVTEIGAVLQAGTNCGSCKPELNQILRECRGQKTGRPAPAHEIA